VHSTQLGPSANRQAAQEPPQGDGIRISRQPGESLENTIPAQEIGCVEPTEPQNGRVQKRQQHLGNGIGMVGLVWEVHRRAVGKIQHITRPKSWP
jgi:hypothetical protein